MEIHVLVQSAWIDRVALDGQGIAKITTTTPNNNNNNNNGDGDGAWGLR